MNNTLNQKIEAHNQKVRELRERMMSQGFSKEFVEGFVQELDLTFINKLDLP
jgi:hypothetical protein